MKKNIIKILAVVPVFIIMLSLFALTSTAKATVEDVITQLEAIDTLQQIQNKRSSYNASGHYDINTTDATIISRHEKARKGYENYVSEMFAKREAAQQAYNSLSDEEMAQIDSALVAKLDNELPNVFRAIENVPVTPRNDEYRFEAVDAGLGFGYEISNHMISGSIPQSFILVDTADGATTWTPNGEYVYGKSNYIVTYCCDKETGLEYGSDYKCTNLENSNYFEGNEAQHIRAVLENSYPFITMDEMRQRLKAGGMDESFVDSLTRADFIAAVQMAVWSYANINDAAADGLEYFASIDVPKNTGIYFTPYHDYTNEVWDWLPGKRTRSYDARAAYRVNTLSEYLCSLAPVTPQNDQIVISEIEVIRTELVSAHDDVYEITVFASLNGGDENDNITISATTYSENADGTITITDSAVKKAVRVNNSYAIDISVKSGDKISVEIDGTQYLGKGAYFFDPEGGRDKSQSLVGITEGSIYVSAKREIIFNAPEYTIEAPAEVTITDGKKTKLEVSVIPEIGAPGVEYSSSDEDVVIVDENGYIEAVGEGEAIITVTLKGDDPKTATINITVERKDYYIRVPEEINLEPGESELLNIVITPDDGKLIPVFSSSDESIVKVDGLGNVTGVAEGTATIYIDFGKGDIRTVPVTVDAPVPPAIPSIPKKHHICFGKTDGIGWYEVSVNGGDTIIQGPNSTLEVYEGSVLVIRVKDLWIDDEFDFYVNGERMEGVANTITVVVDGYMLIGALSMDTEVPDIDESLSLLQNLVNAFIDFVNWLKEIFDFS